MLDLVSQASRPAIGAGLSNGSTSRVAIGFVTLTGGAAGAALGGVVGALFTNSRRGTTYGAAIGAVVGGIFGAWSGYEVKQTVIADVGAAMKSQQPPAGG